MVIYKFLQVFAKNGFHRRFVQKFKEFAIRGSNSTLLMSNLSYFHHSFHHYLYTNSTSYSRRFKCQTYRTYHMLHIEHIICYICNNLHNLKSSAQNLICRPVSIMEGKTKACQPEDKPQQLHGKQNPSLTSRKEQTNQGQLSTQAAQNLFSSICKHAHLHRLGKSLLNHIK